jgi:hypothetical protein
VSFSNLNKNDSESYKEVLYFLSGRFSSEYMVTAVFVKEVDR